MRNFRCRIIQKSRRSLLLAVLITASPSALWADDDAVNDFKPMAEDLLVISASDRLVADAPDQVDAVTEDEAESPIAKEASDTASDEPTLPSATVVPSDNEGFVSRSQAPELIAETRPTLVVPSKTSGYRTQANSTLKMKPVAGPLFGRSNSKRPILQFFQQRQEAEPEVAKEAASPAVPKPRSLPHAEMMQRQQAQQFQANQPRIASNPTFSAQRQHPVTRSQTLPQNPTEKGWVARGGALRDPTPARIPGYAIDVPAIDVPAIEAPAIQSPRVVPARPAAPAKVTPRAEPKLVGPKTSSKKPALAKVPSQELTTRKLPAKSQTPAPQANDGLRKELRADANERRTRPDRIASSERKKTQPRTNVSANGRVGDLDGDAIHQPPPSLDYVGLPAQPFRVSQQVRQMKQPIERVLQYFHDNPEIAEGRSNWGMMHAIMVYGIDTQCIVGNRRYSTIAWIAGNNICRGQRLLTHDATGVKVKSGVGLQGHQAQMLAVFSLCNVPANYPMYAGNTKYSLQDVIDVEKRDCKSGEELTFTLIGLSHYMDTDATWRSGDGQRWDFQRLIAEELSQPIVGTACGGTHRLMGFAHALRKRREEGKPITGQWARAEYFLRDFIAYTYQLQNRDGSMSTNWFEGRGDSGDVDRKIQTTGHMVEFLLTVTPDSQLQDPRLVRAVRFLMASMHGDLGREWKIGPKGHALRSLAMYHDRVFKSGTAWRRQSAATASTSRGNLYR